MLFCIYQYSARKLFLPGFYTRLTWLTFHRNQPGVHQIQVRQHKPTCIEGCPVGINIPKFIKKIEAGKFLESAKVLKETNALPAVCGRVCPQEVQCELTCFYTQKLGKPPVAIGNLERFAADYEREDGHISVPEISSRNGIKVASIGSGPSGLAFAGDMIKMGYDVTVF